MAIPDWTWNGTEAGPPSVETAALEPVSEALGTLSNPDRLEILLVLAGRDGPLRYTPLREATAIDDKGRFNYHLRQLRTEFVRKEEPAGGYELTEAGRTLVRTVLQDDVLLGRDDR